MLCEIIKLVNNEFPNDKYNEQLGAPASKSRFYMDLLKAQLSSAELELIAIHCIGTQKIDVIELKILNRKVSAISELKI